MNHTESENIVHMENGKWQHAERVGKPLDRIMTVIDVSGNTFPDT